MVKQSTYNILGLISLVIGIIFLAIYFFIHDSFKPIALLLAILLITLAIGIPLFGAIDIHHQAEEAMKTTTVTPITN